MRVKKIFHTFFYFSPKMSCDYIPPPGLPTVYQRLLRKKIDPCMLMFQVNA